MCDILQVRVEQKRMRMMCTPQKPLQISQELVILMMKVRLKFSCLDNKKWKSSVQCSFFFSRIVLC